MSLQRFTPGPGRDLDLWLIEQTTHRKRAGDDTSDIVIPERGCYSFPPEELAEFFRLVEACRVARVPVTIMEKQRVEQSGLLIDLDLYQTDRTRVMVPQVIQKLVHTLVGLLSKSLAMPALSHIFVSQRPEVTPAEKQPDTPLWKDGLHIAVPSLLLDRGLKKYLMERVLAPNLLQKALRGVSHSIQVEAAVDVGAASAPMLLQGAAKAGKTPYQVQSIWECEIDDGDFPNLSERRDLLENPDYNLAFEASLNFAARYPDQRTPLVRKTQAKELAPHTAEVAAYRERVEQVAHSHPGGAVDLEVLLGVEENVSLLSADDPDARDLHAILRLIPADFIDQRNKFRDLIFAIAHTSERFYPLAAWFTARLPKRWNRQELDDIWDFAVSRRNAPALPPNLARQEAAANKEDREGAPCAEITFRSIHHWAREANPVDYDALLAHSYAQYFATEAYRTEGELTDITKANVLYRLLKDSFAVIRVGDKYQWYEFVRPGAHRTADPHVFKWRAEGEQPSSLVLYLMEKVPIIIARIIEQLRERRQKELRAAEEEAEESTKRKRIVETQSTAWLGRVVSALQKSSRQLENLKTASAVLRTAAHVFYAHNRDFAKALNADPDLFGVGNGVLKLGPKPQLLRGFHEHYVSMSTPARWRPYDPSDTWIQFVEERIHEMFPEDDAREYIWKYWASSLDGHVKESLFLVLHAPGGEGKSTVLESMLGALGDYATKLSQGLLVGEREKSNEANAAKMDIYGKRFGYFSELDKDTTVTEGMFKEMTGGETLNGRSPFDREQKKFRPVMRYSLITNVRLLPKTNTHGFWRRLLWYYLKIQFVDNPDPNNPNERKADLSLLEHTIHTQEWKDAFLSILVHHYAQLQTRYGGQLRNIPAPSIARDTEHYRNQFDVTNRFICEKLVKAPDGQENEPKYRLDIATLQADLAQWCARAEGASMAHLSNAEVIQSLRDSRIKRFIKESHGELYIRGLRVLSAHEEPAPNEGTFKSFKGRSAQSRGAAHPS